MLLADVNPLIYAHRPESPRHVEHRDWLAEMLRGEEPFGVSELVLAGVLRIITNHRVFSDPTPPQKAIAFCDAVRTGPASTVLHPGPHHWQIFSRLCLEVGARGNVVPDAYHAALAIEHGATLVTTDAGFARFGGLRWRRPLDGG